MPPLRQPAAAAAARPIARRRPASARSARSASGCRRRPSGRGSSARLCAGAVTTELRAFLDHLGLNRNASAHTVAAYASDITQFLQFAAAARGVRARRPAAGAARSRDDPRASWPSCTAWATRARRWRASSRRCARSAATCAARGSSSIDPASLAVAPKREQKVPAHLSVDEMTRLLEMPDAERAARPPRSRDPRAVLRLGAAAERAGAARSRGREPERAHRAGDGQGRARNGWCRSTPARRTALRGLAQGPRRAARDRACRQRRPAAAGAAARRASRAASRCS